MVMLNAAFEKTVMRVEIYKTSAPKKFLEELIDRDRIKGRESKDLPEPADGFTVRQFSQDKFEAFRTKEITEVNFVTRLIASKTFLYIVTVANRGAASAAATRFLSSIRLDQAGSSNTEKIVDLSSLKPVTLDQIAEMAEENTDPKQIQTEKPLEKPENPVIILTKPAATYTEAARAARISGTIRLRLIFGKDGRISKISILKSLPNGLTRNAVMAALRIKFLPQEKENQFETVTKTVEYSFSVG
jgi:TonB family protein